jgi:hypothetical protein
VRAGAEGLMRVFGGARAVAGGTAGQWKWVNGKVLRALVQHVLACGVRGVVVQGGARDCWRYASGALHWAGVGEDGAMRAGGAFGGKVEPHAATALVVVLLDSAARVKLAGVELGSATGLIRAALDAIRGGGAGLALATQAAVYLLAAEWHMLQGTLVGAERATQYLMRVVDSADENPASRRELGDVAHMARTYGSLLTGEKRLGALGGGGSAPATSGVGDPVFVSATVRAAALLAEGVHELRQASVLEAQAALLAARACVVGDGSRAANDQLVGNVCATLATLYLSHQNIAEGTRDVVAAAIGASERGDDLITRARTLRMQRKLVVRADSVDAEMLAGVDRQRAENERRLVERQSCADDQL